MPLSKSPVDLDDDIRLEASKLTKVRQKKVSLASASKQSISLIQRKIWDECKRIVRRDYPNSCYTCGRNGLEGSNWHTGHMWAKASLSAFMKYDLRILRPQCYFCNVNCGGRGAEFYSRMLSEKGESYMKRLAEDRQVTVKAYDHYVSLLESYKSM